jgi:hypothetical protein
MEKSLTGLRGRTKVVIGFGCVWGLFAFSITLTGAFTIGVDDTGPEIVSLLFYGLTILPACVLAIWFPKFSAVWLIGLFPVKAFGLVYQMAQNATASGDHRALARGVAGALVLALVPGFIGVLLLWSEHVPAIDQEAGDFLSRGPDSAWKRAGKPAATHGPKRQRWFGLTVTAERLAGLDPHCSRLRTTRMLLHREGMTIRIVWATRELGGGQTSTLELMANIFISHAWTDMAAAKLLEQRLLAKGHKSRIPVGTAVAGNWRTKYTAALSAAEVLVVLITEASLASKNVLGEIGAARVLENIQGMLMLPVLAGNMAIPEFLSDIYCFRLETPDQIDALIEDLNKAIVDNVKLTPRVFISHRHKDEPIVAELTALVEQAFYIDRNDIRCTSVQPYMLTPGERTSELLRKEIAGAELVIGVLSPDTSESNYVLCELGASWGRDVPTFPVLARGATYSDIPSPLNERHSISLETDENCLQLVDYIAGKTSLRRRDGAIGKVAQQAKLLAAAAAVR